MRTLLSLRDGGRSRIYNINFVDAYGLISMADETK